VLGAGEINTSFDTPQASVNIKFVTVDGQPAVSRQLNIQILNQDNEPVLHFRADKQVRLIANLVDGSPLPIANEIIQFSVSRDELRVNKC
jgi:hypothetical protein